MTMSEPVVRPLTKRQQEIVDLVVQGMSNAEVAKALSVTTQVVKNALTLVYGRLGVRDRMGLFVGVKAKRFGVTHDGRLVRKS